MRIAICDDEKSFSSVLKSKIYDYSNLHNWDSVVDTYDCGYDLINTKIKYDIIILDYQMEQLMDWKQQNYCVQESINFHVLYF